MTRPWREQRLRDPFAVLDGRAGACPGVAQYPALLRGYKTRPPWKVAGIDYKVGIRKAGTRPAITTFPVTAGVDFDGPNELIRIGANNVVFDGYDIGSWTFYISSTGIVIRNCYFTVGGIEGRNNPPDDVSGALTVEYCEFDGAGRSPCSYNRYVFPRGVGDFTMRYCYFHNIGNHGLEFQGDTLGDGSGTRLLMYYNLFDEFCDHPDSAFGVCDPGDEIHLNWLQMFGSFSNGSRSMFNTYKQGVGYSGGQGVQLTGDNHVHSHNTMVTDDTGVGGGPGSCVAAIIDIGHAGESFSGRVSNNYIDRTGARAIDGFGVYHQPIPGTPTIYGNYDMVAGRVLADDE